MKRQDQDQNGQNLSSASASNYWASRRKQKGITMIGMAIILALVAFFALIGIRLFPVYMESYNVSSHIKRLSKDSGTKTLTNEEILNTIRKRFDVDDVKNATTDDVYIERNGSDMTVGIEYEVRTPAIGNVDMLVSFKTEVKIN